MTHFPGGNTLGPMAEYPCDGTFLRGHRDEYGKVWWALGAWPEALNDIDKLNAELLPWSPWGVRVRHALSSFEQPVRRQQ
jgi:hypothetical protein